MKRYCALLASIVLLGLLTGCYYRSGAGRYAGSGTYHYNEYRAIGDVIDISFTESGYTSIELRYIDTSSLTRGKTPQVKLITDGEGVNIRANETLFDDIDVFMSNDTLIIEGDRYRRYAFDECVIEIGISGVDRLTLSGPFEVQTEGVWTAEDIRMDINGAAQCDRMEIDAGTLRFSVNGASAFTMSGTVVDARLTINGASDIRAFDLLAESVDVQINGAGTCEVNASDDLNVRVAGVGTVRYKGTPELSQSIAGLGTVTRERN